RRWTPVPRSACRCDPCSSCRDLVTLQVPLPAVVISVGGAEDACPFEVGDHFLGQRVRVLRSALEPQFGTRRGFVGIVDPGESLDFAGPGFLVEPFGIALFAYLNGGVDEDLLEIAVAERGPNRIAVTNVRADEGRQSDDPGLAEQLRDGADPANVLLAVLGGKTQPEPGGELGSMALFEQLRTGVEPVADVVAVQQVAPDAPLVELLLDDVGHRALAAAAQPGEPDDTTLVTVECLALAAAYL